MDKLQIEVFPATINDIVIASSIMQESAEWLTANGLALWTIEEVLPERIAPLVQRGELYLCYYCEQLVGTMVLQWEDAPIWPDMEQGTAAYIHRLAIRREMKGLQLAKEFVNWAKVKARDEGRKYLRLDCSADRPRLRAYYESMGFGYHSDKRVPSFPGVQARYQLNLSEQQYELPMSNTRSEINISIRRLTIADIPHIRAIDESAFPVDDQYSRELRQGPAIWR